MQGFLGDKANN